MTQPLPTQAAEVLDVFGGTESLVYELEATLSGSRAAAMKIAYARVERSVAAMASAHTELEKLLGQSRLLSESLGRVIQFHVNRRKAQS